MIRFSKKENYGLIFINELVKNFDKKLTPLSEIAKKYKISPLFLRNIALDLRRAGLIQALEGKNGGYKLKKAPNEMTVGNIISALSNHPIFSCCQNTKNGKCQVNLCPHGFSLQRLNNEFLEKISKITLDSIA